MISKILVMDDLLPFESILLDLRQNEIDRYPWFNISKSVRIRIGFIDKYIDRFPWKVRGIFDRPDITIDFIIRNQHLCDCDQIYSRLYINNALSADDILKLANSGFRNFSLEKLDTIAMTLYKPMTMEQIRKYVSPSYLWLAARSTSEPEEFLAAYPDLSIEFAYNPEITESMARIIMDKHYNPSIIAGHRLSIEFIRQSMINHPNVRWTELQYHPDITPMDFIIGKQDLSRWNNTSLLHIIIYYPSAITYNIIYSNTNLTTEFVLLYSRNKEIKYSLLIKCMLLSVLTTDLYDIYMNNYPCCRGYLQDLTLDYFRKHRDAINLNI